MSLNSATHTPESLPDAAPPPPPPSQLLLRLRLAPRGQADPALSTGHGGRARTTCSPNSPHCSPGCPLRGVTSAASCSRARCGHRRRAGCSSPSQVVRLRRSLTATAAHTVVLLAPGHGRWDLVVVPPDTTEEAALPIMARAAGAGGDRRRA